MKENDKIYRQEKRKTKHNRDRHLQWSLEDIKILPTAKPEADRTVHSVTKKKSARKNPSAVDRRMIIIG
jgi:hypothetical protein